MFLTSLGQINQGDPNTISLQTCGRPGGLSPVLFDNTLFFSIRRKYSASFSVYLLWLIAWVQLGNFKWENTGWISVGFSSIFHVTPHHSISNLCYLLLIFSFANFSFETIFTSIVFGAFTVRCFSLSSLAHSIVSTCKPGNMVGKFIFSKVNVMGKSQ